MNSLIKPFVFETGPSSYLYSCNVVGRHATESMATSNTSPAFLSRIDS